MSCPHKTVHPHRGKDYLFVSILSSKCNYKFCPRVYYIGSFGLFYVQLADIWPQDNSVQVNKICLCTIHFHVIGKWMEAMEVREREKPTLLSAVHNDRRMDFNAQAIKKQILCKHSANELALTLVLCNRAPLLLMLLFMLFYLCQVFF